MTNKVRKTALAVAGLAALGLGGGAIAGATDGDDRDDAGDPGHALTGATLDKAAKAALAATSGGEVTESETDDEDGATYEVEVTRPDGSQVDVRLDDQFRVVVVEGDSEDDTE